MISFEQINQTKDYIQPKISRWCLKIRNQRVGWEA